MDIESYKKSKETQLKSIIRSNLVSFGLTPEQIEGITEQLFLDIIDVLVFCE